MNAAEFLERAGPLLLADEARHNLILGVAGTVRDLPHLYPGARFWVVDGAAAVQTPPYNAIVAKPRDREALAELVRKIDVELPGVTAAAPEAEHFAGLWGRPAKLVRRDNIWELRDLLPPRPAAGRPRRASRDDLPLLLDWFAWFQADEELVRRQVEQRLASDDGGVALWEADGEPVSAALDSPPRPTCAGAARGGRPSAGARHRRAHTRAGKRSAAERCEATEAIYARLGYGRVAESRQYAFA